MWIITNEYRLAFIVRFTSAFDYIFKSSQLNSMEFLDNFETGSYFACFLSIINMVLLSRHFNFVHFKR